MVVTGRHRRKNSAFSFVFSGRVSLPFRTRCLCHCSPSTTVVFFKPEMSKSTPYFSRNSSFRSVTFPSKWDTDPLRMYRSSGQVLNVKYPQTLQRERTLECIMCNVCMPTPLSQKQHYNERYTPVYPGWDHTHFWNHSPVSENSFFHIVKQINKFDNMQELSFRSPYCQTN